MLFRGAIYITILALSQSVFADNKLDSKKKQIGYSVGFDFIKGLAQKGIEVDRDSFLLGVTHALDGKKPQMDEEAMTAARVDLQKTMREQLLAEKKAVLDKNLAQGKAFLEANMKKKGVISLPSGLQYKVIKSGKGKSPGPGDTVETNYRGTLIDGTEFDSSYKRNKSVSFKVTAVIKGWTEALQIMKVGDKWELYIPSNLAYGNRQVGQTIGAGSTLIFEIELVGIK